MIDGIPLLNYSGLAGLILIAILTITRRLVWHTDMTKALKACQDEADRRAFEEKSRTDAAIAERDKWQQFALDLLGVTNKLTVHAEIASEVISRLPDPGREEGKP